MFADRAHREFILKCRIWYDKLNEFLIEIGENCQPKPQNHGLIILRIKIRAVGCAYSSENKIRVKIEIHNVVGGGSMVFYLGLSDYTTFVNRLG